MQKERHSRKEAKGDLYEVPLPEDDLLVAEPPEEELPELDEFGSADEFQELLKRLRPNVADAIEMYYLQRKTEADIALILGTTQQSVSYRVRSGVERMRTLLKLDSLVPVEVVQEMNLVGRYFGEPRRLGGYHPVVRTKDFNILVEFWRTRSPLQTVTVLGIKPSTRGQVSWSLARWRDHILPGLIQRTQEPSLLERMLQELTWLLETQCYSSYGRL